MTAAREQPITVRAASDADRATAMAFISPATPRGRASLVLLRTGQGLLWVANERDEASGAERMVGMLLANVQIDAETEEPLGYIQELLVHPASRRRGVAMHLLDAAEAFFLREQGFPQVALATSPDNEAALRLYRSRGYTLYQVRLSKRRTGESASEPTSEPLPAD